MLNHFLALGGNEIVNSARAYAYALSAECPVMWLDDPECDTISAAEGDGTYGYASISEAPWFDTDDPDTTGRFLGLYGVDISGLSDSTRTANITQKTTDGAVTSGYRHAAREVRVRAWMSAIGGDALEAGMTWLRNVLEPNACGIHGGACGESEASFFVDCPPARRVIDGVAESDAAYFARVDEWRRFLHSVRCISGPFIVASSESTVGKHVGHLVEFTILAEVPWVFGVEREIDVPPTTPSVVQDIAYNLAPFPSAEISEGVVVVATNLSPNPSLETDATGWSTTVGTATPDPTSIVTFGRNDDIAAVGSWSYRARLAAASYAAGVGGVATITLNTPTASLAGVAAGTRISLSLWAAALLAAGAPPASILSMRCQVAFVGAAGGVDLGYSTEYGGHLFSTKGVPIPAGATGVRMTVTFTAQWYSTATGVTASDIRLYADAMAVTIP